MLLGDAVHRLTASARRLLVGAVAHVVRAVVSYQPVGHIEAFQSSSAEVQVDVDGPLQIEAVAVGMEVAKRETP
ncbi:hypothetical protein DV26_01860 [Amycolatopsis mediterranei]|uniref:Uncharacterized protein n=1 Tax=Amycolatopsis mediterranei (strain S699) TaxID=713604 RepID=A0A9R0UB10_AMYMS|nr:hypothetical protein RAM_28780 [Amycolatopsis mediterranei S699]KDO12425.1 hypothetical protein DV26_01860 [Amycolatopsis mediterranei]KDU88494.1 hypothetical protein DV36_29650 [Amycolatopsis mediterranei]